MDEDFEFFLEKFGPTIDRVDPSDEQIARYRNRLPDQLLDYWKEFGWCGYADGLYWTVNPEDYIPARDAWLDGSEYAEVDRYHVIARTAFGDLFLWGEQTGPCLEIVPIHGWYVPSDVHLQDMLNGKANTVVRHFFSMTKKQFINLHDINEKPLFDRALKKLGPVSRDEMYGFVPATALGGPAKLDRLQKLSIIEHLVFLAQVSEPYTLPMPDVN